MNQCTSNLLMIRPASFQYNLQTAESNDYQTKTLLSKEEAVAKAQAEFDAMVEIRVMTPFPTESRDQARRSCSG